MKRHLSQFTEKEYDILIIGGGILGLFVAWDAALRGLTTALVEKSDFGAATSSNSLRIIHGGFRYLQNLDLKKTRRFIRERTIFMNIAPHLVRPMPVIIPIYGSNIIEKNLYVAAINIYELLGIGVDLPKEYKNGNFVNGIISKQECIEKIPGIQTKYLKYGVAFTDCQLLNSERFNIQVASSAVKQGAHLANYVEALSLIISENTVKGAAVKDRMTGEDFEIRAKITIDASGPWLNRLLLQQGYSTAAKGSGLSKAFNILINKDITNGYALGMNVRINNSYQSELFSKNSRYHFITPFRGKSLIGTEYLPSNEHPKDLNISDTELTTFLKKINTSFPKASLTKEDVEIIYGGYVPTYRNRKGKIRLGIQKNIYDHEKSEGLSGLLSAKGSKYTEARIVAQETIDLALNKLGRPYAISTTDSTALNQGASNNYESNLNPDINWNHTLQEQSIVGKLKSVYGVSYKDVLSYIEKNGSGQLSNVDEGAIIKAQIRYAVREEMAQKLTDALFRRIDIEYRSIKTNLSRYSETMSSEMNWDKTRKSKEENEVLSKLSRIN